MNAATLEFYTRAGSNIIMTETVRNTVGQILTSLRAAEEGIDPARGRKADGCTLVRHCSAEPRRRR